MSISDTTENAILALIFNATAWANYADNAASTPQTNIAMGLHTADPGDTGTQTTSETSYTSYARGSVARTSGGWTVSGTSPTQAALAANLDFAACTGGTATITHFSTGKTGGGATAILLSGTVSPNISVSSGVTPRLTTSTVCTLD
jgi:hypothetical protein